MDHSRRLKFSSIFVLGLLLVSLLEILPEIWFGDFSSIPIEDGTPANILLITKIFVSVVSVICLLPSVYIGIKGLKIAYNPDSSKAHIVWGCIVFVFTVIGAIAALLDFLNQVEGVSIFRFLSILVDVVVLFEYVQSSIAIAKEN